MGGVGSVGPPSKRRKVSSTEIPEKSSVSMADDAIGSKGVKKVEFVRLIADALHSLGYRKTGEYLEKESGITLFPSVINEFSQQILDGNWDESLNSLRKISILDESVVKSSSFVILEQKFLQLLDSQNPDDALRTLRTEITPLSINHNRVRELSSLVLCSGQAMVKPKPRSVVLHDLQKLFPPNVMIPEGRLLHLVEQALDLQRDSCSFHNSLIGKTSLFIDHNCGKDQIPSKTLQILQEHEDEVWFLQFSHNGKFLASSSRDKSAIIWEVNLDGKVSLKHRLLGHKKPVSSVSWSPNDDQILTCGVEDVIKRWDVISGECLCVYQKNDLGMVSCCWTPEGDRVFSGATDKSVIMWDLDGNELESWPSQKTVRISDLQIMGDGRYIVSICKENMIDIFDRSPLGCERIIKENHNIVSFTLSEDKKFLLVSLVNQEIHLWRIHGDIRLLARYKGHKVSRFVVRACFGGLDQAFVASGSEDSRVYIWYRETGELLETLAGHSGAVNCTSWNPTNPHMLASASDDRTIHIWGLNHVD
ncbi:WD repeat-containing protein 26 homolog [Cynara cardunculus var. scolymus]|uniref:CTLH, C-terminal LisH motif-containing protein n=1 Tax=Cynara cardunculus var. scolymus TaxID=59895 RepID=A0A103XX20_CYNCS|nr:WD repeat-containing protein 26 homolog [Cynara cardunculus var. scolymus]KVH98434.1 CTLH, C-terminal LisH motif-containing protein [Cynara cardunculus var. scolymus]